ncbi:MAG: hypothetical protein HC850_04495 [Rhodomicrobium sp.]|nr:hypothetical protein [Rhodomicrobium sp.]
MVDTAERNIERRMRTNQFYFSITAAVFVVYSYLNANKIKNIATLPLSQSLDEFSIAMLALPVFLIIVSMSWFSLLLSFRSLSKAKYAVICEIESDLPIQPFTREWDFYKKYRRTEITVLELVVPFLFYVIAAAVLALGLFGAFWL